MKIARLQNRSYFISKIVHPADTYSNFAQYNACCGKFLLKTGLHLHWLSSKGTRIVQSRLIVTSFAKCTLRPRFTTGVYQVFVNIVYVICFGIGLPVFGTVFVRTLLVCNICARVTSKNLIKCEIKIRA